MPYVIHDKMSVDITTRVQLGVSLLLFFCTQTS